MRRQLCWIALGLAGAAQAARAQVGYTPARSPYRDLGTQQTFSLLTGYYGGSRGSAGVGPSGGPLVGVRYEIRIGGPAQFTARVSHAFTERRVLDPDAPRATRNLGTRAWPINLMDVGLTVNLTGQKSYRGIVPILYGGVGVASDFGKKGDPGGFKVGTPFAFSFGTGARYVPGGRLELRADLADYLFTLTYPDAYFIAPEGEGETAILPTTRGKSQWTHNLAIMVGGSYAFFR